MQEKNSQAVLQNKKIPYLNAKFDRRMSFKSRLLLIALWAIIPAAFIGPGTVTASLQAGAAFEFKLLWVYVFATIAAFVLQEASVRVTIFSGKSLGEAISSQFEAKSSRGFVLYMIAIVIILGSAAFEAGNIIGAKEGLSMVFHIDPKILVLIICGLSFLALSMPTFAMIAKFMGFMVIFMGLAFMTTAIMLKPDYTAIAKGCVVPFFPSTISGSILLLGLIGTTVVPYNLFFGSLGKDQTVSEMRFGLSIAVIIGGLISISIVIVGTLIKGDFNYDSTFARLLQEKVSPWAVNAFGIGLFAASFASSITAPLASAITAQSLFRSRNQKKWDKKSFLFRAIWGGVILVGLIFGMIDSEPVTAIILAQALNALILPLICIFLLFVVNDPRVMTRKGINTWFANVLTGIILWVLLILGLANILNSIEEIVKIKLLDNNLIFAAIIAVSLLITAWTVYRIYILRMNVFLEKPEKQI